MPVHRPFGKPGRTRCVQPERDVIVDSWKRVSKLHFSN